MLNRCTWTQGQSQNLLKVGYNVTLMPVNETEKPAKTSLFVFFSHLYQTLEYTDIFLSGEQFILFHYELLYISWRSSLYTVYKVKLTVLPPLYLRISAQTDT